MADFEDSSTPLWRNLLGGVIKLVICLWLSGLLLEPMGIKGYGSRDDPWERIEEFLPGRSGSIGRPGMDNRLFIEAVLYRYRAGIPWRELPERFGDFPRCEYAVQPLGQAWRMEECL